MTHLLGIISANFLSVMMCEVMPQIERLLSICTCLCFPLKLTKMCVNVCLAMKITLGFHNSAAALPAPFMALLEPRLMMRVPLETTWPRAFVALAGCVEGYITGRGFVPDLLRCVMRRSREQNNALIAARERDRF